MMCRKQEKKKHQRKIMLNKTEWLRMEFVGVSHEAEEGVLEWSWCGDPQVQPFL